MSYSFDLLAFLRRQRAFSLATFGPGQRTKGTTEHIRKELKEIEADPNDLKEWIDVILLALDGAARTGATEQEIVDGLMAKLAINEARDWPDWRVMGDRAIEHVRQDSEVSAKPEPYLLFFVINQSAFFTKVPASDLLPDGYSNRAYELCCEYDLPFLGNGNVLKLAWDGDFRVPLFHDDGKSVKVGDLLHGDLPWLSTQQGAPLFAYSGVTVDEFDALIRQAHGTVYYPKSYSPS